MNQTTQAVALAASLISIGAVNSADATPIARTFDNDVALLSSYELLGTGHVLPISTGLSRDYEVQFSRDSAGGGIFNEAGNLTLTGSTIQGTSIGFRLVVATLGEAQNTVDAIPSAELSAGPVDPQPVALLLPAVQSAREAGGGGGGGGGTCEPPPELVCEPPPDSSAVFDPVDWLVFDFGEPLLSFTVKGSYLFEPDGTNYGPNDMAVQIFYLRQLAVPEPAALTLFGLALAGLGIAARRRKTCQPTEQVEF